MQPATACYILLYPGFGCRLVLTHHGWFIISLVRRVEQEAGPQMFCPVATEAEGTGGQSLGEACDIEQTSELLK